MELAGVDAGGVFDVRIQLLSLEDEDHRARFTVSGRDFVGLPVRHLLPGLRVMEALHAPNELLWRPEFGPAILGRIPMPSESVIQLPTGSLRLMEALNLIQEHTSIPIVMPEELTPEQMRDILTTAQLLRDGVLKSTWTTGALVLRPEAPDDALEAIGAGTALFIGGDEWVVSIGQETVPLGPCHRIFFHPQIAGVQELEDGSRRVVFEPAGGEPGRAEERLGPVPGSWCRSRQRLPRWRLPLADPSTVEALTSRMLGE